MSNVPPTYALEMPMAAAMRVPRAIVAKPTVTDTRAPYTTRLQMSRERLSVPIQNRALGACIRPPGMLWSYG